MGREWAGAPVRPGAQGEARRSAPPTYPWAPSTLHPPPILSPASSRPSVVGRLSPTVLAPPGLVGVKKALAEEQGVQGHVFQQQPTALLRCWGSFQLQAWGEGRWSAGPRLPPTTAPPG